MTSDHARSRQVRREQLRDFLRKRRARITPGEVGIETTGVRRTPGLRREELAMLAGVGVSWYTWLEQGRDITVSKDVLDAIARALRLTQVERAYLFLLAGLEPEPAGGSRAEEVTAEVWRMLDAWGHRPAVLRDRYWNIVAFNQTARYVFGFDGTAHNCLITYFTNPRYRAMPDVWASAAPSVVAAYRADTARGSHDPGFQQVVDKLRARSPEFAELWERHDVGIQTQAVNALLHPEAGELFFEAMSLTLTDHPDWNLVLYNPKPRTAERLDHLQATTSMVVPHPR